MNVNQLEEQIVKKVSIHLIPFLFLCFSISILDRVNIGFAALQMNKELGFSSGVYGLGAGIFFIGYFLLEVPGGAIMTKVGASKWICRIMVSWGIVSFFMIFIKTPMQFYIVRFLLGMAEASFFPCMAWYLSNFYQAKNHAKAIAGFMIAIPAASAIGSPISSFLLTISWHGISGWQWLFIVESIPSIIIGIISYFYLDDSIEKVKWLNDKERKWLIDVTAKEKLEKERKKHYTFMQALGDRDVLVLSLGYFCWIFGYYGIVMFLPTISSSLSSKISIQSIGLIVGLMYFVAMITMYMVGRHSDKTNERRIHVAICLLVSAVSLIASIYCTKINITTSFIFLTISLSGAYGAYSPFWAIPPSYITGPAAAGAIALINSIGNLGGFFGPYAVGYIRKVTGSYNVSMWLLAVSMIISAFIVAFIIKQSGKAQHIEEKVD
ncbi:MFS transporter [Clostridium sp. MT-14]|uniref:MFS transporter n=1 Tax=Clostridium sp. MT-14 TaxID=3348360 RepID=UPI0035F38301